MTTQPQIRTIFCISGDDLHFDAVSVQVGLKPTKVWRQSNEKLLDINELENSCWSYELEKQVCYSTDDAVDLLLDKIWPFREKIKTYGKNNPNSTLSIVVNVFMDEHRPLYEYKPQTLTRIAEINCSILMDIF